MTIYASPRSREDQSFAESSRPAQRWLSRNRDVDRADFALRRDQDRTALGKQEIAFHCDDPSVPKGDDNLVVRAAKVFFEETKITSGVSIELKKKIPHGAGLGGGSSDAASTLLALNELFETNLPREALAKMAEMIGSDVPFFIFQSAACAKDAASW